MDNFHGYDAQAGTIKISDITSRENNTEILHRLKNNDESFASMCMCNEEDEMDDNRYDDSINYCPESARDLGWLGYFVGNNIHLTNLTCFRLENFNGIIELFCRGLKNNNSIQSLSFCDSDLSECDIFRFMVPFFRNNNTLTELELEECEMGAEVCRSLSLALGGCKNISLKRFALINCGIGDEPLVGIILALSMHPQLEELGLQGSGMGRNGCVALATLLRWRATELHTLNLSYNGIDDEGVEALTLALANSRHLHTLALSSNSSISIRGWWALSTFLSAPSSNLQELFLACNDIGDEGVVAFAGALTKNHALKKLIIYNNPSITAGGWAAFSKLLCDTTSVNKTFLSNHTLHVLARPDGVGLPSDLVSSLNLNSSEAGRKQIAMIKILTHHNDFDLQPLFEWDFKVLPFVISWLEAASICPTNFEKNIRRRKLSSIYQFVRDMPMMYIEVCTSHR
mmetsp:Transcript_31141/g.50856  ORF Transcript_31141/g.50856 Transcript_31141/m.50856 type:complete len:457 (+) Transcript_31141:78-1448(+)